MKAVAVARNVPLLEPAGIVSEAGTVRKVELELRAMVAPADAPTITVQVLEAPGAKVMGLHAMKVMELITGATLTLTVPPVPVTAIASPVGEAPRMLLMVTGRALLPDRVTVRVSTTPAEMAVEFNPHATQVEEFSPPLQDRVLPAEDNAGPAATTVRPVTLLLG